MVPPAQANVDTLINELDMLLAGGRFANVTKSMIANAMVETAVESPAQRAQQVAMMSPEFNVMGVIDIIGDDRNATEDPFAHKVPESYRAMVHVYLDGGVDSFNMLVPYDCDLWTQYTELFIRRVGGGVHVGTQAKIISMVSTQLYRCQLQ